MTNEPSAQQKNNSGFSLVEVMIALTMLAIAGAAAARYMTDNQKSMKALATTSSLDRFELRLRELVQKPTLLLNTRNYPTPASNAMQKCINAGGTCNVGHTDISLIDPLKPTSRVAGTPALPVYVDLEGNTCDEAPAACPPNRFPLLSRGAFSGAPAGIKIYYCLMVRPDIADDAVKVAVKQSGVTSDSCATFSGVAAARFVRPRTDQFKATTQPPISFGSFVDCSAQGKIVTGVNADGSPICGTATNAVNATNATNADVAQYAMAPAPATGKVFVQPGVCPSGTVMAGVRPNGQLECQSLGSRFDVLAVDGGPSYTGLANFKDSNVSCPADRKLLNCVCFCGSGVMNSCHTSFEGSLCTVRCTPWEGSTNASSRAIANCLR